MLAVEYLHSQFIIYRDIKPENSIVNCFGKVFLIDLGTAKMLKKDKGLRTDTIIGTPHSMAPEVMQGKGYSLEADYWSLGVLFYEFICGRLPFAEKATNPFKIYEEIMRHELTFPLFVSD
jgi:cGMP-dependent protein kinase